MEIWHLAFASDGRLPLVADEAGRRRAIHAMARVAGEDLALFSLVDDHIHLVLREPAGTVGRRARALVMALRTAARNKKIEPARVRPVEDRAHLRSLVGYLLTQVTRHGVDAHPALWSGSCFQDLAGARVIEGMRLRTAEVLPRLRLRDVQALVGLEPARITPATDDVIRRAGVGSLVRAGAAALAAPPELAGGDALTVSARRLVAQLGIAAELSSRNLAWALDITPRSVRRYLEPAVPAAWLRTARTRPALERLVRGGE